MFSGRKLVIATKHSKELVMAPLLEAELGVQCIIPDNFDTDQFGTFSGEIARLDDPFTTARNKCLMAMNMMNCDLAVASEGSFGPHPTAFFTYADDEFVLLLDRKNNLEIFGRAISMDTNFSGRVINTNEELALFASEVGFPDHAIILRNSQNASDFIVKGITDWDQLLNNFQKVIEKFGTAFAEADMRALYNPKRMKIIEIATKNLIEKVNSFCPACQMPGFSIRDSKPGLPCSLCDRPTRTTLAHVLGCSYCSFSKEILYPNGMFTEDPGFCDYCNP